MARTLRVICDWIIRARVIRAQCECCYMFPFEPAAVADQRRLKVNKKDP